MIWSFFNFRVGSLLGGDADPRAVARLNLPTFESAEPSRPGAGKGKGPVDRSIMKEPEMEQEVAPFTICETLPVVPAKLVKKILKGEFVDMAELLKDNMEAERRRYSAEGEFGQNGIGQRGSRREVPDILSWVQCYSMYAAVICNKYPEKARELWAYQATLIGEHRRCGGRGWLLYDSAFRQHVSSLESTDFSRINQGLYSTTFLAYRGKGQFCQNCMLSDHSQEECALNPSRSVPVVRLRDSGGPTSREDSWSSRSQDHKRTPRGACFAWNDGNCSNLSCRYSHMCSRCGSRDHRRPSCRVRLGEPAMKRERLA